MVDIPLDRLLEIGYDDLHRNQAEFKRVAAQIDPNAHAGADPGRDLENDHPSGGQAAQLVPRRAGRTARRSSRRTTS